MVNGKQDYSVFATCSYPHLIEGARFNLLDKLFADYFDFEHYLQYVVKLFISAFVQRFDELLALSCDVYISQNVNVTNMLLFAKCFLG